jgi:POT family proton-dependent oligopeptide transporter
MHLDALRDRTPDDDLAGQAQAGIEAQEAGMHPATNPPGPGDEPHRR